jgi:cytochrome c2
LTDILWIENSDSIFHYELRVRNSSRQLVYYAECKNGVILKEYTINHESNNVKNGEFLFKNACAMCHLPDKGGLGASIRNLSKLSINELNRRYTKSSSHDYVNVSNDQFSSIQTYIKKFDAGSLSR